MNALLGVVGCVVLVSLGIAVSVIVIVGAALFIKDAIDEIKSEV